MRARMPAVRGRASLEAEVRAAVRGRALRPSHLVLPGIGGLDRPGMARADTGWKSISGLFPHIHQTVTRASSLVQNMSRCEARGGRWGFGTTMADIKRRWGKE